LARPDLPGGRLFSAKRSFWRRQTERPARYHEFAFALVMNHPGPFSRRVNPRLDDFQETQFQITAQ